MFRPVGLCNGIKREISVKPIKALLCFDRCCWIGSRDTNFEERESKTLIIFTLPFGLLPHFLSCFVHSLQSPSTSNYPQSAFSSTPPTPPSLLSFRISFFPSFSFSRLSSHTILVLFSTHFNTLFFFSFRLILAPLFPHCIPPSSHQFISLSFPLSILICTPPSLFLCPSSLVVTCRKR